MKNFVQDGRQVTVTAPYAVASGVGCLVGSLFGVTVGAAALNESVDIMTVNVFTLAKATGAAWTQGARIYWDDAAKNCTTAAAAGANKLIGVATAAAASGDTTGNVLLTGAFTI